MAGILYVVATPIGNLEDVTLRALRILGEVSLIAAEDTRRTARLLQHYSISTRTTSLHEHNEHEKTPKLIERLRGGESLALVSDAGTPLISDPGRTLVAAARAAGVRVESIPGPSAVMAAVASCGFETADFLFLGFPPIRSKDRKRWLEAVGRERHVVVFFEAPHRVRQTFEAMNDLWGPNREIAVARELTKVHEELVIRPISQILAHFSNPKGEFTILVPPVSPSVEEHAVPDIEQLRREFGELTDNGRLRRREALKVLAERHGVAANDLYRQIGEPFKSVD